MHLVAFLLAVFLAAGRSVLADWNPVNSTLTCLFLTTSPNWQGEMQNLCQVGGKCAPQLPDGLTANISSAGPTDGQTCFLYSDSNCTGLRSAPIVYPGYNDLSTIVFDKMAVSWRCWKMCGFVSGSTSTVRPAITTTQSAMATPSPAISNSSTMLITITTSSSAVGTAIKIALDSSSDTRTITATLGASVVSSPSITTTLSPNTNASPSIVTTLSESVPPPALSSTSANQATSPTPPTLQTVTSSLSPPNRTTSSETATNTNTPGFSMTSSPITITHTYVGGSTTVVTTDEIEPVPTI